MPASVMPGRSGVTAPITPDSRTTGTTDASRRSRAGTNSFQPSTTQAAAPVDHSSFISLPLPRIYHFLSRHCYLKGGNVFCIPALSGCNGAAEKDMKIYLLIMLIGTLLAAIHFTSVPEQRSETLPQ